MVITAVYHLYCTTRAEFTLALPNLSDMQLESLFTIRASKQTSGLVHFRSKKITNISTFISNFQVVHLSLRIN